MLDLGEGKNRDFILTIYITYRQQPKPIKKEGFISPEIFSSFLLTLTQI